MEIQNILTLIQAFTDHSLNELNVEDNGVKISLKKDSYGCVHQEKVVTETVAPIVKAPSVPVNTAGNQTGETGQISTVPPAMESDKVVVSPLVGVFYSASAPDAEAFVKVGDVVKKGQVLGIIEAMKLMNEIESEYDGVVEAILVKNEDVVEYNQPLFRIR